MRLGEKSMKDAVLPVISKHDSDAILLFRIFAIFSVITAHVNVIAVEQNTIRWIVTQLLDAFGQVGVVCFFILGGFLYYREPGDDRTFFRKKFLQSILLAVQSANPASRGR